jgi:tetratricopeptide (TPR) repeat protein
MRLQEGETAFHDAAECLRAAVGDGEDASGDAMGVLAKVVGYLSCFSMNLNRDDEVVLGLVAEGLGLVEKAEACGCDVRAEEGYLRCMQGIMEYFNGHPESCQSLERSLALYRELGDRWSTAEVLVCLSRVNGLTGDHGAAKRNLEESQAIYRDLGDAAGLARSVLSLGGVNLALGRLELGERLAREGLTVGQELGDRDLTAHAKSLLGAVNALAGEYEAALAHWRESISLLDEMGLVKSGCNLVHDLGRSALALGRYAEAREHLQEALDGAYNINHPFVKAHAWLDLGRLEVQSGQMAEAKGLFEKSIAAFKAVGLHEGESEARCALVYAVEDAVDLKRARENATRALEWVSDQHVFPPLLWALPAAAMLLLKLDQTERAVEVYELACTLPAVAKSRWVADVVGQPIGEATATLPLALVTAAKERGRALDMRATLEELLAEWGSPSSGAAAT